MAAAPVRTVKELIAELQKYLDDMLVIIEGYKGGFDDFTLEQKEVKVRRYNTEWYSGKYQDPDDSSVKESVQAVILLRSEE